MKKFLLPLLLICGVCFGKDVEIHFSPNPENGKIVADFVRGTQKTLLIAAYALTSPEITAAIREVEKTKAVEIVCDKADFKKKTDLCKTVSGKPDKKAGLMHNKVMIRDNSCVLTGSFNFTNNAIQNNRENFLILCDEKVAKEYTAEFEKIYKNNT